MQERVRPSSGTADDADSIRVGRIPRQKVRVPRERLLDAAMQALETYGTARTILEIEYAGEVGVGLVCALCGVGKGGGGVASGYACAVCRKG